MSATNVPQLSLQNRLPRSMQTAQAAICLPEVQDMLQRLSEYGLGVFMPHMHDATTGRFQPLGDKLMQVESGLAVSFQPVEEIANQAGRYLPVGWCWRAGGATSAAACEMVSPSDDGLEDYVQHKMP
ncbi:hypothetical protein [Phenylobacterium sp.]|uniref:hypothetical protein n=1 Tax=Phenylobacterium sp. TaxID=1871053 RepID=UPI00286D5583|nr:hypothetical protein [Phenylobacterium sp.]